MTCPTCISDNSILLRNTTGIEKGFKTKDDYTWNINILFCMNCNNIYGEKS